LGGFDALLSMAQMPRGVPVGVMAVGGAANGALFAARILALSDDGVRDRLRTWQQKLRARVEDGDRKVQQRYPSG
jgi:5-(carboxyamino)imidazole ribonucleotide mutase